MDEFRLGRSVAKAFGGADRLDELAQRRQPRQRQDGTAIGVERLERASVGEERERRLDAVDIGDGVVGAADIEAGALDELRVTLCGAAHQPAVALVGDLVGQVGQLLFEGVAAAVAEDVAIFAPAGVADGDDRVDARVGAGALPHHIRAYAGADQDDRGVGQHALDERDSAANDLCPKELARVGGGGIRAVEVRVAVAVFAVVERHGIGRRAAVRALSRIVGIDDAGRDGRDQLLELTGDGLVPRLADKDDRLVRRGTELAARIDAHRAVLRLDGVEICPEAERAVAQAVVLDERGAQRQRGGIVILPKQRRSQNGIYHILYYTFARDKKQPLLKSFFRGAARCKSAHCKPTPLQQTTPLIHPPKNPLDLPKFHCTNSFRFSPKRAVGLNAN